MKKNSVLTLVMMTLIITLSSFMNAEHQSEESYNIKRAKELIQEKHLKEAVNYLVAETEQNPKSAIAYDLWSIIKLREGEPGEALSLSDMALKNYSKKDNYSGKQC